MRKIFRASFLLMLCVVFSCAVAEKSFAPYGETEWFDISVLDATEMAVRKGYAKDTPPDEAFAAFVAYVNDGESIERIAFSYDKETLQIKTVVMYCKADREAINLISNLSDAFGDGMPCFVSGVEGTAISWQHNDEIFFIIYNGAFSDLAIGKLPYIFMRVNMNDDNCETEEMLTEVEPTDIPTATPIIKSEITIPKARLERNSAGTTEAYITLHNNMRVTVDRIDFYVKCFDAYGNHIKGYNTYDVSSCFYDEKLRAGDSTPSDIHWSLYGFTGVKKIEIAVISYHTQSGVTVEIPEDQLVWKSFK